MTAAIIDDRINRMMAVGISSAILICTLIALFVLPFRTIRVVKCRYSIKIWIKTVIAYTILFSVGGIISAVIPIFFTIAYFSLLNGVLCYTTVQMLKKHSKELENDKSEYERIKNMLIEAQKPDETALRIKELLPAGNTFLIHTAEAIKKRADIADILSAINNIIIEQLNADGGVILTIDGVEDILSVKAYSGEYPPPYKLPDDVPHKKDRVATNFKYAEFPLHDSFFGSAVLSAKPILITDALKDSRVFKNGEEPFLQPGSIIVLPMIYRDNVTGIISLARNRSSLPFSASDIDIGEVLASYAAAVLKLIYNLEDAAELNTIENETDIAGRIQKILLPKKLIDTPELNAAVIFNQARGVCSDYYDIIQNGYGRIFCITADIAGKSIHACIIMSMIRSLLYLITGTQQTARIIVDTLNKGITGKIGIDHYATLSFLTYIPAEHRIEYVNAGHQSLLLWKKKMKKVIKVDQKTDPIGVDSKSVYTCKKLTVEKGDIAILYTDGLIEALNPKGEPFGLHAIAGLLTEHQSLPAKKIADKISHAIKVFTGKNPPHDDQTMLIIKVK